MAKSKEKNEEVESTVEPAVKSTQFSKAQIIASDKFKNRRDLLSALLDENEKYTVEQVETIIQKYLKGRVK